MAEIPKVYESLAVENEVVLILGGERMFYGQA